MAEGWIRYYGGSEVKVFSAGINPSGLNANALKVMAAAMIDISGHRSKKTDELPVRNFDYIITLCDEAKNNCPLFDGKGTRLHRSFPDPSTFRGSEEEIYSMYEELRDSIEDYSFDFIHSYIRPLIPGDLDDILKL